MEGRPPDDVDLARRALPPTLPAAGAAYLTYVSIVGTEPLFTTGGAAPFDVRELLGGGAPLGRRLPGRRRPNL